MNVGGIVLEPWMIYGVAGAAGGFLRTLNHKVGNPDEPLDYYKVARNLMLGAVGGIIVDSSPVAAFSGGLTGEYLLQSAGSKLKEKISK